MATNMNAQQDESNDDGDISLHSGSSGEADEKSSKSREAQKKAEDSIEIVDLALKTGNMKSNPVTDKYDSLNSPNADIAAINSDSVDSACKNGGFRKSARQPASPGEVSIAVVDSNAGQDDIVFQKDKLLEPSIDFAPDQKVQKSKRRTTARKKKKKHRDLNALPDFLEQAQDLGCDCDICRQHLALVK